MSHRTHHGHLIALHTERVFAEPAILALLALAALLLAIGLAGCATTTADCTDIAHGVCKLTSTRLLTDNAVTLATPAVRLDYSSKPDQAGTQAALNALAGVITVLVPAKPAAAPIITPGAGFALPDRTHAP